jgi:hypothetical protein
LLIDRGRHTASTLRLHCGSLLGHLRVNVLGGGQQHGVFHVYLRKLLTLFWRHCHKAGNLFVEVKRAGNAP